MKLRFLLAASLAVISSAAHAQTVLNVTGATAFRKAAVDAIVAGYGGIGSVGIVHSNTAATLASAEGANAISFSGTFAGVAGTTIIRCRWSGSTEGIRDLVGTGGVSNDVFYYPDASIPAIGTNTPLSQNTNPVGANVAQKPDVAFSDVQQTSSPSRTPTLAPADSRVGVITFSFVKSQGSSANLTNVTAQAWRAALGSNRGVPLNVFTGLVGDQTGRVLATGRNDGSGTRAVYLIETGYGVSKFVNQFKLGANGFNGVTSAGLTGDSVNFLQLWPSSDAEDANNSASIWNTPTTGNGGYFSGGNVVANILTHDTSAVRVLGPTGTDLPVSGSYTPATSAGNPRAMSVVACVSTADALTAITGGASAVSYNGVGITPVPVGTDPTGLVPTDRYKVTNGTYTLWSYERLFNKGTLSVAQDTIVYGAGGIKALIPANLANTGVALSAMTAVRGNDGDVVTQP